MTIAPGIVCSSCRTSFRQESIDEAVNRFIEELDVRENEGRSNLLEADFKTIARAMDVNTKDLRAELIDRGVDFRPELPNMVRLGTALKSDEPEASNDEPETRAFCPSCDRQFSESFTFCPECGSETTKDLTLTYERRITQLETEIKRLLQLSSRWRWIDVEEGEKWKVWWGVWWRGAAIGLAIYIVILMVAAGSAA